jgi:hypothetical protein
MAARGRGSRFFDVASRALAFAFGQRLGSRSDARIVASLLFVIGTTPAGADELPYYSLSWTHGEGVTGCATLSEVAAAVEARLGHRVFASATDARRFIDARVESAPVGYRVVIDVYEADGEKSGERSISTADVRCRALDQPLSLMLALIIDPTVDSAPSTSPVTASPKPVADSSPPIASPTQSVPAPPSHAEPTVAGLQDQAGSPAAALDATTSAGAASGAVELKLGFGILPGAAPGVATSLLIPASRHWLARLGATVWAPRRTSDDQGSLGAGLEMSQASLGLCRYSAGARLGVLACVGVEPGLLVAQSYGLPVNSSGLRPALDLEFGARAGINLGAGLSVLAGGDLLVPTVRTKFEARDAANRPLVIFQRSPIGGSASLGIGWKFFP